MASSKVRFTGLGSTLPDETEPSSGLSEVDNCCKAEAAEVELVGGAAWAMARTGIRARIKTVQERECIKDRNAVYSSFQHGQIKADVQVKRAKTGYFMPVELLQVTTYLIPRPRSSEAANKGLMPMTEARNYENAV